MLQIWNPCPPGWVCSIVFPVGKWWHGNSGGSLPRARVWNSFGCPYSGTPSWSVTLVSLFRVYSHVIKRLKCTSHSSHYYLDSGEPISICVLGETVIPGCFYITVLVIFSFLGVCNYTSSLTLLDCRVWFILCPFVLLAKLHLVSEDKFQVNFSFPLFLLKKACYKEVKSLFKCFSYLCLWNDHFGFLLTKWLTVTIPSFLPHDVWNCPSPVACPPLL